MSIKAVYNEISQKANAIVQNFNLPKFKTSDRVTGNIQIESD